MMDQRPNTRYPLSAEMFMYKTMETERVFSI